MKPTLLILCGALASCNVTRSSHVIVGAVRPAISPASVKVYSRPPAKFEEIAILKADSRNDFATDQSLVDSAMERMRQEAAGLGANGVLLQGVGEKPIGTIGSGSAYYGYGYAGGFGSSTVREAKTASGTAIHVTKE